MNTKIFSASQKVFIIFNSNSEYNSDDDAVSVEPSSLQCIRDWKPTSETQSFYDLLVHLDSK